MTLLDRIVGIWKREQPGEALPVPGLDRRAFLTRRDVLRYLLATPLAVTLDVERLLWVPRPIITVPARPLMFHRDAFSMVTRGLKPIVYVTVEEYRRLFPDVAIKTQSTLRQGQPFIALISHNERFYQVGQG